MTTKPETKFWRRIKNKFTKITFIRIEAVTPTGLPDLNGLFLDTEKRPHEFWVELKVSSGNRVRLSPGQISWHMNRFKLGGMVTPLEQRGISVYSGGRSLDLASQGLNLEPCAFFPEPCVFSNLESWFMNHVP
jgi:hypothetical protein